MRDKLERSPNREGLWVLELGVKPEGDPLERREGSACCLTFSLQTSPQVPSLQGVFTHPVLLRLIIGGGGGGRKASHSVLFFFFYLKN